MSADVADSLALLRSPPFPWASPDRAAVSIPGGSDGAASLERLIAAIAEARVGGSFWAERVHTTAPLILRPTMATLSDCLAEARGAEAVAILERPDPTIQAALQDAAIRTHVGPCDPWSVLRPGVTLVAAADDEWTLLAAIAGAGTRHDPANLRAALIQALGRLGYRDCFTGARCDAFRAVAILAEWRRAADRTHGIAAVSGIAWWKREAIERFLWLAAAEPPKIANTAEEALAAADGGAVAVWPSRMPEGLAEHAAGAGVPLVAVEDGFIRSVGLGAGLHPPSSIVVDTRGIYYDPTRPSDLEHILETTEMPAALLERAATLRETTVAYGISKYASDPALPAPTRRSDRRTVLVAGQVEDDQSVLTGGGGIAGNLALLVRARAEEPDAHILFKPHPDVDAGHRAGRVSDAEMLRHADEIVRGGSMAALLAQVDAVHVLTSLTGFEALQRGVEVIVHGGPFYAGWGLTRDLGGPFPRRTRRLTLDQLVAGALLLYPLYLDPETQLPCPPEVLIERFRHQKAPRPTILTIARALQGRIAKLFGTTTD